MATRAERDAELEKFMKKLVENGVFYLPAGAITHEVALAAFAGVSRDVIRRQLFHRVDGDSVPSRRIGPRSWVVVEDIIAWIREEAKRHRPNPNMGRNRK